jgi:hypothetical protein
MIFIPSINQTTTQFYPPPDEHVARVHSLIDLSTCVLVTFYRPTGRRILTEFVENMGLRNKDLSVKKENDGPRLEQEEKVDVVCCSEATPVSM